MCSFGSTGLSFVTGWVSGRCCHYTHAHLGEYSHMYVDLQNMMEDLRFHGMDVCFDKPVNYPILDYVHIPLNLVVNSCWGFISEADYFETVSIRGDREQLRV